MKKIILTLFVVFLSTINSFSQSYKEMTVYKNDNTQLKVSGYFIFENSLIQKIQVKNNSNGVFLYNIGEISKVIIEEKVYVPKEYMNKKYLFQELIKGNLSLYKDRDKFYLDNNTYGLKIIPQKENELSKVLFKPGTISLFINKCKSSVDYLYNESSNLSIFKLKRVIDIFNSCSIQKNVQIADGRIKESMRPTEKIHFGASIGLMNLSANFSQFQSFSSEGISSISLGGKVIFSPNAGKKGLNFNFAIDYFIGTEKQFNTSSNKIISGTQFISALFGTNYLFKSSNEKFKPYLGLSGGFILNSDSYVNYSDTIGFGLKVYSGSTELVYNLNAGALLNLFGQEFDLTLTYQPTTTMSLFSKVSGGSENVTYDISAFNLKLTYIF